MSPLRFKPYPAYKDSGVEWLGEIPAHWEGARADALLRHAKVKASRQALGRTLCYYSIPLQDMAAG